VRHPHARLFASAAIAALFALSAAGCQTMSDTTGSIAARPLPRDEASWRKDMEVTSERYQKNPADADSAIRYAQGLRATGQRTQAAAVLQQAAIQNPKNTALLGAYGRALADVGSYNQALDVLSRAHTPDNPDWRILSAQGAVLDQMGQHEQAQRVYANALKIIPDEPTILSNLGLSYALSKDLPKAEATLKRAVEQRSAEPKVRQNLALVVGLQGRFAEAETIARGDLSPDDAAANVTYLRQMMSQQKNEMAKSRVDSRSKTIRSEKNRTAPESDAPQT
jgi:Flp pilus assembly protein TadD